METPPPLLPDPEATRNRYLNHEASVQAIGSLYLLGCGLLVMLGFNSLFGHNQFEPGNSGPSFLTVVFLVFAAAEGWVGWQLRKLDPRAKLPATILAILGLFAFPIGTLINAYVLYLLHSAKGKYVLSPEYRTVIEATPHIRYKMSIITWVLIWFIIAVLLLGLWVTLFDRH